MKKYKVTLTVERPAGRGLMGDNRMVQLSITTVRPDIPTAIKLAKVIAAGKYQGGKIISANALEIPRKLPNLDAYNCRLSARH